MIKKTAVKKTAQAKILKQPEPLKVVAKRRKKTPTETLVDTITDGMKEKKALNIVVLDLRKIAGAVTDFFVVCHGNSTTHVESIANSVDDMVMKKLKLSPSHVEGFQNSEWILLDYFDVVAHVFIEEKRDFYRIENLWADAVSTVINN